MVIWLIVSSSEHADVKCCECWPLCLQITVTRYRCDTRQHTLLAQFFDECSSHVAPASTACSMDVYFNDSSCIFQDSWVLVICQQYRSMKNIEKRIGPTLRRHTTSIHFGRKSAGFLAIGQGSDHIGETHSACLTVDATTAMLESPSPGVNPEGATEMAELGPVQMLKVDSATLYFFIVLIRDIP